MVTGDGVADVYVGEVDGVTVMWAPVPSAPFTVGLLFRVGRADEQLARAGVTHLLEHLALYEVGRQHPDLRFNGQVDSTTTSFHMEGTPEQAVTFVREVCTNLHALPGDRLDTERDILRAESKQHAMSGAPASLTRWRFGARGFGLPAYDEFGLHHLTLDDLHAWATRFATKGNALVWLTGEPPAGLRIPLPDGPRVPVPDMVDVLPRFPAWFNDGPATAAGALTVVTRSLAGQGLRAVLERRLVQRIRYDLGATYSPVVSYLGVHPTQATLMLFAEPVPGQEEAVAHELLGALAAVAEGDVPQAAVDAYREEYGRAATMSDPGFARSWVANAALMHLTGARELSLAGFHDELAAIAPGAIAEKAAEAAASALYRLPPDVKPPPGIVAAPMWSSDLDGGRRFESRRSGPEQLGATITVGPAGLSLERPDGNIASVRAAEAEALLVWQHDQRTIIGADAISIDISPAWWQHGDDLVRELDAAVPVDRHVQMRDELDPPTGPSDVGEPGGIWVVLSAAVAAVAMLLVVAFAQSQTLTVVPIFITLVLVVKFGRMLQRTRRVRGLPYSDWPR